MGTLRGSIKAATGAGVGIEFDADLHVYRVDGVPWPSVTQCLSLVSEFTDIPESIWRRAADRGTEVHKQIEAIITGAPRPAVADGEEDWVAYRVAQFERFVAERAPVFRHAELRLAHPSFRYCGTADFIAVLDRRTWLVDVKTGGPARTHGPQTAAYQVAYNATLGQAVADRATRRACLYLTAEGYRLAEQKDLGDWPIFQSCLNLWRFKNGL